MATEPASAMRTALIRVAPLSGDDHYPVSLHLDDGGDDWLDRPAAEGRLPRALSPPAPPLLDGEVATPERIRSFITSCNHESPKFEEIGRYLYALLTQGAVGALWTRLAASQSHDMDGEGHRLLLDIQPVELRHLPWELMRCDGPLPVFADLRNPCARVDRF